MSFRDIGYWFAHKAFTKVWGFVAPAIAVSFTLPHLQASLGEEGVFGTLLLASLATWAFAYAVVPQTKGLPMDTVSHLFD